MREGCSAEEEKSIFFDVHLLGEVAAPGAFPHIMDFVSGNPVVVHMMKALAEAVEPFDYLKEGDEP